MDKRGPTQKNQLNRWVGKSPSSLDMDISVMLRHAHKISDITILQYPDPRPWLYVFRKEDIHTYLIHRIHTHTYYGLNTHRNNP